MMHAIYVIRARIVAIRIIHDATTLGRQERASARQGARHVACDDNDGKERRLSAIA